MVRCLRNGGVPGVDGQSFDDIEKLGRDQWLDELAEELRNETYQPRPVRRVYIPAWFKNARFRVTLGISARTLIGPALERVYATPG